MSVHSSRVVEKNVTPEFEDGKSELLDFIRKYFGNQEVKDKGVALNSEKCLNHSSDKVGKITTPVIVSDELGDKSQAVTRTSQVVPIDTTQSEVMAEASENDSHNKGVKLKSELPKVGQRISYLEKSH